MVYRQRGGPRDVVGEGAEGNLGAAGRLHVDRLERFGILLEAWRDFQDDVILVQLREDRRDLTLTEGVVERVVDRLRLDTQPRRGVTVDHHRHLQAAGLLIGGDVAQLGERP